MPKGSRQVPCDWRMACIKSSAVSSSHLVDNFPCDCDCDLASVNEAANSRAALTMVRVFMDTTFIASFIEFLSQAEPPQPLRKLQPDVSGFGRRRPLFSRALSVHAHSNRRPRHWEARGLDQRQTWQ